MEERGRGKKKDWNGENGNVNSSLWQHKILSLYSHKASGVRFESYCLNVAMQGHLAIIL